MIGARLILSYLWLAVWLTASPAVCSGALRSADNSAGALVSTAAAHPHEDSCHFLGIHCRSVSRVNRRADFRPVSNDPPTLLLSQAEIPRHESLAQFYYSSPACVNLACAWQFCQRTALSPRDPSPVS